MKEIFLGLLRDEEGQGMTEYGLIIALVAVVVIAALGVMSGGLNSIFNGIGNKLSGISVP